MRALNQQVSEMLDARRAELSAQMVARKFTRQPELERRHGKAGREKCLEDAGYHLAYLAQAIAADETVLFGNYIGWAKVMLGKRGVPEKDLEGLLEAMREALLAELPPELSGLACEYLDYALAELPRLPGDVPTFIPVDAPLGALATQYLEALLAGQRDLANQLILQAAGPGKAVRGLYLHVFQRTQYEIGRLWQVNQINVAQEHYCTAATQLIMAQLHPYVSGAQKTRGTLVATCVAGDLHEVGTRMISDFFEMDGWNTHYLGANMPQASVVQMLVAQHADLLAISATITYHVAAVAALIAAVRREPACAHVKIIVGGSPFKIAPDLWQKIGADGFAADAAAAVALGNQLTGFPRAS